MCMLISAGIITGTYILKCIYTSYFAVPFERGSAVDIETDSLLLKNGSAVKVKWPRDLLVPSLKSIDIKNSLVDIKLYERNMNSESQPSRELATLASNIPNTGETDFVIPDLSDMIGEGICEVSIKVEVKSLPTSSNLQIRRSIPKFVPFILPAAAALLRFSIWAGKLYLRSNIKKKVLCQLWACTWKKSKIYCQYLPEYRSKLVFVEGSDYALS